MGTLNMGVQFTLFYVVGSLLLFSPVSAVCNGGNSCCNDIECGEGEGDCDTDSQCSGSLECGTDNCVGINFDPTDDCCYDPNPSTAAPVTTTETPFQPDCKALKDAEELMRNTRIAYGCDVGNPDISLDSCSQISCLEDVLKKSATCTRGPEQMDCMSLQKVSTSIEALNDRYCQEVPGEMCGVDCTDQSYIPKTCVFTLTLEQLYTNAPGRMADGASISRPVLVYNRVLPGPNLVVCEGDNVKVHLKNRLSGQNETLLGDNGFNMTTLHFHGIRQLQGDLKSVNVSKRILTSVSYDDHGPWSDGVPLVTQCPVHAGKDFHYFFTGNSDPENKGEGILASFNNAPAGSYWYHSHFGNQRLNGAAGKLIVMPRKADKEIIDLPENSLFLQEWYPETNSDLPCSLLVNGKGRKGQKMYLPKLEPGETKEQFMERYLMGGPVSFDETEDNSYGSNSKVPYEVFEIYEKNIGKEHRFRLISGIGQGTTMRISIEDHSFTAIAADSIGIEKTPTLDAVWLAAGERYDILVKTKSKAEIEDHPSAYKINVFHTRPNSKPHELCSIAWLKYPGQTVDQTFEPDCKSVGKEKFANSILNPVPNNFAEWNSKKFIYPKDLTAKLQVRNIEKNINTHYVNMSCSGGCNFNHYQMPFPMAQTAGSVAASGYPNVPILFQSPSNQTGRCGSVCDRTKCTNQGPPERATCSHVIQQPSGNHKWFEIVLINTNPEGDVAHPIHQHGGWYNIIGQGQYDYSINRTFIIDQDTTKCPQRKSCLPRNLDHPVFKDTVQVPTNGYVIFRTPLDNPGAWIVHCHINFHVEHGMAMVFQFGQPREWAMGPNLKTAVSNWDKMCFH